MAPSQAHLYFMQCALKLAEQAYDSGEVPVGAVVVYQNRIVGEGYNQPIAGNDPSAHAEVLAIRAAAMQLGNYRLPDCSLYVTLEPCTMCVGLMVHARIEALFYGAQEPKAGAIVSAVNFAEQTHFNHKFAVEGGIMAAESAALMSQFFRQRRLLPTRPR